MPKQNANGSDYVEIERDGEMSAANTARTTATRVLPVQVVAADGTVGAGGGGTEYAVNAAAGAADKGTVAIGVHRAEITPTAVAEGDYTALSLTEYDELRTRDQRHICVQNCNAATDWTALNNDTTTIADSVKHVFGTGAISFDKANGAANTVYACIQDTITPLDLGELFEAGGFVGMSMYLSSLTNVVNAFLRLGTSASHYNQWTWPVANLTAAAWMNLRTAMAAPDYTNSLGNGWNPDAVTYVAVGVTFAGETNTLSGILVDHVHAVGGRVTMSDTTTNVSTTVNTANVNINRVGGVASDMTNNGAAGNGTLRVTVASDSTGQIKLAAGTEQIGTVLAAGHGLSVQATLTVTNGAYTAQDAVGGLITFAGAVRANGKESILNSLLLAGLPSAIPFELWLFNADLATPVADNAAFAMVAADQVKLLGVVPITAADYFQAGAAGTYYASIRGIGAQIKAAAATTSIYAYLKHTTTTSPGVTTLYLTGQFEFVS